MQRYRTHTIFFWLDLDHCRKLLLLHEKREDGGSGRVFGTSSCGSYAPSLLVPVQPGSATVFLLIPTSPVSTSDSTSDSYLR